MKPIYWIPLAMLSLTACAESDEANPAEAMVARIEPVEHHDDGAPVNTFGFHEAMQQGPDPFGADAPPARMLVADTSTINVEEARPDRDAQPQPPAANQQIAYTYGYGFQVSSDKIAPLQQAHVALCEKMGSGCRVLRMSQASADSYDGFGELRLQVASDRATTFGNGLAGPAEELGGELVSSVRDGEDLSEQIIDTEARLQSRLILRDKLTAILRNNRGSVDELVKAESAVAEVNEEIDATRSKLEQFRNRIRYSAVNIEYEPYFGETQLGFSRPVMTAFRSIGTTLGMTIASLVYLLTAAVPIVLFILGLRWVLHRFGLRVRFWKGRFKPNEPAEA